MDSIVADVFINNIFVGTLKKAVEGYSFQYDEAYISGSDPCPISYSFPVRKEAFRSSKLFPFFTGLVSEGWLLRMQSQMQQIDERDYFSLLLENGEDLIGAITVRPKVKI